MSSPNHSSDAWPQDLEPALVGSGRLAMADGPLSASDHLLATGTPSWISLEVAAPSAAHGDSDPETEGARDVLATLPLDE